MSQDRPDDYTIQHWLSELNDTLKEIDKRLAGIGVLLTAQADTEDVAAALKLSETIGNV